jgi:hypothetical protein
MAKQDKIRSRKLDLLEEEFIALLPICLRACAKGRWGLFGQNDLCDPDNRWLAWPEADHLKTLASEIRSLHSDVGTENEISEKFLTLCALKGPNVPGEPKLAASFLAETGLDKTLSDW